VDALQTALAQTNNYVLYVTNNFMIGETRIKSNPVLNIFFDGQRISFIGGAGVSYALYGSKVDNKSTNPAVPLKTGHVDGHKGYFQFSKFTWWKFMPHKLPEEKSECKCRCKP
jgi:hypothetical protein